MFSKFFDDFTEGATYFFKAAVLLIQTPALWLFIAIPMVVGVLLSSGFLMLICYLASLWMPATPEVTSILSYLLFLFCWILFVLFLFGNIVLFVYYFSWIVMFLTAPVADDIVRCVEKKEFGLTHSYNGFFNYFKYYVRTLKNSLKLMLPSLLWSILLIPVAYLPLGFIFVTLILGYYISANGALIAAEHANVSYDSFRKQMKTQRVFFSGNGAMLYLAGILFPYFLFIFIPMMSISGALAYHDRILKTPHKGS